MHWNTTKTHCKHGHEFTVENTLTWHGKRACKLCVEIRRKAKQIAKNKLRPSFEERFWSHVNKVLGLGPNGDCWEWTAASMSSGYGVATALSASRLTHRISYELHHGLIDNSLVILHACDNPKCVNPAHLSQGTVKENIHDMMDKGRMVTWNKGLSHCKHGHEYTPETTRIRTDGKKRTCLTCESKRQVLVYRAKADAATELKLSQSLFSQPTLNPNTYV